MLDAIERWPAVPGALLAAHAERRQAARRRRPQPLPVLAGLHGVVRAPLRRGGREAGRRLLRHHAGAHQADARWRCTRWRRRPPRGAPRAGVARVRTRAADQCRRCRAPTSRGSPTRCARPASCGIELVPPAGLRLDRIVEQAREARIRGARRRARPDGAGRPGPHERAGGGGHSSSRRPASRPCCSTAAAITACTRCRPTCSARTRWASAICCS